MFAVIIAETSFVYDFQIMTAIQCYNRLPGYPTDKPWAVNDIFTFKTMYDPNHYQPKQ